MHPFFENKPEHIYALYNTKSYDFPAHFHNNLEIEFCFYGQQNVQVGENYYELKTGDALVIFPNNVHEYIVEPDVPTQSISIIFNTQLLAETIPDIVTKYPNNPVVPAKCISKETYEAFKKLVKSSDDIEKIGLAFIILSELMQNLELLPLKASSSLPSMITSYIDSHFTENLTISHIAKVFGYNTSYISHIFCDQLKIPFRTYLGSLRCEYAAKQIRTSKKSLTEIAYESGFNSLNTFCRCFKTHMGKTPTGYRKEFS